MITTFAVRRPRTAAGLFASALSVLAFGLASSPARAESTFVRSFDGTKIHLNFFPAAGLRPGHRAATILVGPGWGSAGDTDPNSKAGPGTGYPGLGPLRHAGFNVLTWDPRGFGLSGGQAEVDSPAYEGRDVSTLISWLARQPQALLDKPGDPRVGMAGGSYGGGIQLVSAAIDPRIDAIVPDIAWHSLVTSLDKNNTMKLGWASLLYLAASADHLDPLIGESFQTGRTGQPLTGAERHFYLTRGPGALVNRIRVPTLLVQGTVDTLFTLQEAITNYGILERHHVPVKMLWFCGGHGVCLTNPGDQALIVKDTIAWLDRYLKRNPRVRTGPGFQWVDQTGGEHSAAAYPLPSRAAIRAHGTGTLTLQQAGGAGPLSVPSGAGGLGAFVGPITPARAANAVNLRLPAPHRPVLIAAAPTLALTYRGTGTVRVTSVFAQLIDDRTGLVLGNQITPLRVRLDGATHTLRLPLEVVAAIDRPGEHFTLQITASTVAYAPQLATGTLHLTRIALSLPTAG